MPITFNCVEVICCKCGVLFGLNSDYNKRRLDDHAMWYCPNGHPQHYTAKSDAELQFDRAEAEVRNRQRAEAQAQQARDERDTAIRRLRATKGVLTITKRRIAKGACPCCHKTFDDLKAHVTEQHPKYAAEL